MPGFGVSAFSSYVIALLGLVSFSSSLAAEFLKTKTKDMKLMNGSICSMPQSPAYGLGITAIASLVVTQIVGNFVICSLLCSWDRNKSSLKRKITISVLFLSWISFAMGILLLGAATSMNKEQKYWEGWLDGGCYVVKNGIFACCSVLISMTTVLLLIPAV